MRRSTARRVASVSALLLIGPTSIAATSIATAAAAPSAGPAANGGTPNAHALVHRTSDGRVDFLGSTDGRVLQPGDRAATALASARAHLTTVAPGLGLDSPGRDLVSQQVLSLKGGGSVVRFDQRIGGVPVFGGQVVLDLDGNNGLTSVLSHVSAAKTVAAGRVSPHRAEQAAVQATALAESAASSTLHATTASRVVYDPGLVPSPAGGVARAAWQVEVDGGPALHELVLIDAATGGTILSFNQVDSALNRRVCNNFNVPQPYTVPCTYPSRSEGAPPTGNFSVDTAYRITGQTAKAFHTIAGIDLTEMIGVGKPGHRQLRSTVNWCDTTSGCPASSYQNAFWNGKEMYFGKGFEAADDVVAHELTHGVTQHTSDLFYWYQSGAMNESFSDVFGEIVDRRFHQPGEAPDVWLIGEDLPMGAVRSMIDPTAFGDPDSMTSSLYSQTGDVHVNSGVGNKTFYLVSQGTAALPGGSFNGVVSTGIDGTDPSLAKSALLYYDTLVSLTSGSEYADLARVLEQQCGDLAAAGTLGFTPGDCTQVADAVQATQLDRSPPGAAAQPSDPTTGCPALTEPHALFDGQTSPSDFTPGALWIHAPNKSQGIPSNQTSAGGSWAGFAGPVAASSSLIGAVGVPLPANQTSYLRFSQWRLFASDSTPTYYDGGTVGIQSSSGSGYQAVDISGNAWVNGPQQTLHATGGLGFGGSSSGWITSRLDLTPQAGQVVRPVFTTRNDPNDGQSTFYLGWYVDDVSIYTCQPVPPTRVGTLGGSIAGGIATPSVTLTWTVPSDLGAGLTGYQVGRTGMSGAQALSAGETSFTFSGLSNTRAYTLWVRPIGEHGVRGPKARFRVRPVSISLSLDHPAVQGGQLPLLSGRVIVQGTTTGVPSVSFRAQYRYVGGGRWRALHWPVGGPAIVWVTNRHGRYWASYDRPSRAILIRVVVGVGAHTFGALSSPVTQRLG